MLMVSQMQYLLLSLEQKLSSCWAANGEEGLVQMKEWELLAAAESFNQWITAPSFISM